MSRRKSKFEPDKTACIGNGEHENFGTIYESLVKSKQFQSLSMPAKLIYMYCRINARTSSGRACLFNHGNEEGMVYSDEEFVFPASQQAEYGLKRTNTYRYMQELIKAGFIEVHEQNKHRHKVNVYRFSSQWKFP